MTTPSVDRPVEPMGDDELHFLEKRKHPTVFPSEMARIIASLRAAEARALPRPRRYTGGPLEDGLYLWREDYWGASDWDSWKVSRDQASQPFWFRDTPAPFWLIGPITIPDIPSEEASS